MTTDSVLASCERCPLAPARAVTSRGPVPARLLLLSGAPRVHEEREGVAFASPAFAWLESALAAAGINPATVHYATLTACRPPYQRPVRAAEITACASRLEATIEAIAPEVIVLCGREVVGALLPSVSPISGRRRIEVRGRRRYYPIRHPYATLHCTAYMEELDEDLRCLAALLDAGDLPDIATRDEDCAPVLADRPLTANGVSAAFAPSAATDSSVDRVESPGLLAEEAGREVLIEAMNAAVPASMDASTLDSLEADGEPGSPGSPASPPLASPGASSSPDTDAGGVERPEQLSLF